MRIRKAFTFLVSTKWNRPAGLSHRARFRAAATACCLSSVSRASLTHGSSAESGTPRRLLRGSGAGSRPARSARAAPCARGLGGADAARGTGAARGHLGPRHRDAVDRGGRRRRRRRARGARRGGPVVAAPAPASASSARTSVRSICGVGHAHARGRARRQRGPRDAVRRARRERLERAPPAAGASFGFTHGRRLGRRRRAASPRARRLGLAAWAARFGSALGLGGGGGGLGSSTCTGGGGGGSGSGIDHGRRRRRRLQDLQVQDPLLDLRGEAREHEQHGDRRRVHQRRASVRNSRVRCSSSGRAVARIRRPPWRVAPARPRSKRGAALRRRPSAPALHSSPSSGGSCQNQIESDAVNSCAVEVDSNSARG